MKVCHSNGCDAKIYLRGFCNSCYRSKLKSGELQVKNNPYLKFNFVKEAVSKSLTGYDECIVWPFGKDSNGYGSVSGKALDLLGCSRPHRAALLMRDGISKSPLNCLHGECNNPACINPNHLSWGDQSKNAKDRIRDGTSRRSLNEGQVKEIKSLLKEGFTCVSIARKFDVTDHVIYDISRNRTYKYVA